jgi:hypothetical protein
MKRLADAHPDERPEFLEATCTGATSAFSSAWARSCRRAATWTTWSCSFSVFVTFQLSQAGMTRH